ncbi:putative quinol monooxygenase [Timonella sp. A28]|uniref:putative quinol monooxygenase n=1 Tax=Timonella sp. A28 TaxID=3442640 RepID=UPI003EBDCB9E
MTGKETRPHEITLTGLLICTNETEAHTVREHLPLHVELTRAEKGCISFTVNPTSDPLVWEVKERFIDETAFQHHQHRTSLSVWAAATKNITREYNIHSGAKTSSTT